MLSEFAIATRERAAQDRRRAAPPERPGPDRDRPGGRAGGGSVDQRRTRAWRPRAGTRASTPRSTSFPPRRARRPRARTAGAAAGMAGAEAEAGFCGGGLVLSGKDEADDDDVNLDGWMIYM